MHVTWFDDGAVIVLNVVPIMRNANEASMAAEALEVLESRMLLRIRWSGKYSNEKCKMEMV